MLDITEKIGFKVLFDESTNTLEFGPDITFIKSWEKSLNSSTIPNEPVWKSFRFAKDFTDDSGNIIKQPNLNKFSEPGKKLYFGNNGVYWKELINNVTSKNLVPDITILPPYMVGEEFNRTEGHEHLSKLPEVYENIYGENIFLLFKLNNNKIDIDDIIAVFAKPGDHVVFPPDYQHISINIGNTHFIMTDWNSKNANSNFMFIKKHNGAPYWVIKGKKGPEFKKNPRYKGIVPKIRKLKPVNEIKEFGFKKNEPMFNLGKTEKIELLNFLNDNSDKYSDIYKKAFVSIE